MQSSVALSTEGLPALDCAWMRACPDAVFLLDRDGVIEEANGRAEVLLAAGACVLRGKALVSFFEPGPECKRLEQSILAAVSENLEVNSFHPNLASREVPIDVWVGSGVPSGPRVIVFARERWDLGRVTMQLHGSHHLEAIGRLSSGIAHEINTPIQFVGNSATFLETAINDMGRIIAAYRDLISAAAVGPVHPAAVRDVRELEEELDLQYLAERIPEAIARINHGVARVAEVAHAMRTFAHRENSPKQASDLNRALDGALLVARSSIQQVARLETRIERLPFVVCHASEVGQVFLNLLINAVDAVAASGKIAREGLITVEARSNDESVEISVADNGCGIPEAAKPHIFEAFFTTKGPGEGTGQGLAIAREAIEVRHHGKLTFRSVPGEGTEFRVVLPIDSRANEGA